VSQLAVIYPLVDVGRGLREGFFMFWETLWALVLGFSLSGLVQALVSKDQMQLKLGSHRPAAIARAAGYGLLSSSCSYGASAMSKSLFARGADFVTAMVFMVASTNLVVELGIVMLVLLGWQFMVAEFVGGPIMIIVFATVGGFVFGKPIVEAARRRITDQDAAVHGQVLQAGVSARRQGELDRRSWSVKLRSPAALADAASCAVADATMLRRELVIGYGIAGFLAVLVPTDLWNALFVHGHGFATSIENALVGPIIAILSCVCSIGNVPLAAALWSGGISFGGVISFIFADLIAAPLILIYRKLYGLKLTAGLVGLFYVVMAIAGLATEGIFRLVGAIPTTRAIRVASAHFAWNYTAYLNVVFLGVAAGVWWLARNGARFGGGFGYANDPVCGMQVRVAEAPAHMSFGGRDYWFCSDRCRDRFAEGATPSIEDSHHREEARSHGPEVGSPIGAQTADPDVAIDPICGMKVDPAKAPARRSIGELDFWFCGPGCAAAFDAGLRSGASEKPAPNRPTD